MNSLPFGQLKSFLKILIGVQYKSVKIRTYAFLPHDFPRKFSVTLRLSPIFAKNACGVSATGFTQKRHTLYAYYNGWGRKFQMLFQ